jgi:hypothetical protein
MPREKMAAASAASVNMKLLEQSPPKRMTYFRNRARFALLLAVCLLAACSSVMRKATNQFAANLSNAILNEDDPPTVRDGVPAYLLLIDGMVEGDPQNPDILLAGAKLYGAYLGGFVDDNVRAQRMANRAYSYARRALCVREKPLCATLDAPFDAFDAALKQVDPKDIADLPKLQALLLRLVSIDPQFDGGSAYLYLGVLSSIRPASLGGKPEEGKAYFDKALELSRGKNQMVKVLYAQFYGRLVFDKELHDRLLNEVLVADPVAPGLTLINTLAKAKAKALLESGKDYF